MQFRDPYDWQMPGRQDLMSLSTINQQDVGHPKYIPQQVRNAGLVNHDIDGSKPFLKPYQYTNKQSYGYTNQDIHGSQPKNVFRDPRPPHLIDNSLRLSDIKGTHPKATQFETNRAPVNPLNPQYQLSTVIKREPTPPRFLRDNINVNDIEGTKPNPHVFKPRKDQYSYDEIEGSHPKKPFVPNQVRNSMDVKDINKGTEKQYNRLVDPLNPVYKVQDENGKYYLIGDIQGSHNRRLHPVESNKVNYSLTNKDINGAQADTHSQYFLRYNERKDYRPINQLQDINGAQSGTKKVGIQSLRNTNPLNPGYVLPGHSEDVFGNPRQSTRSNFNQSVFTSSANQNLQFTKGFTQSQSTQNLLQSGLGQKFN